MIHKSKNIGVVLSAGMGSRLASVDDSSFAKPILRVGGVPLLVRTLHSLELAMCQKVIVVLGYQAEIIKRAVLFEYNGTVELQFVYNPHFNLMNGVSLLCAKPYVDDQFILTMADHILDDKIMSIARGHRPPVNGASLCVDYKLETIFDINDATKVLAEGNLVKAIGKDLKIYNCIDTGVFIATPALMTAIGEIYDKTGDASLSDGVHALSKKSRMTCLDIADAFWQDVDTPNMRLHAESLLKEIPGLYDKA